MSQFPPPYQPGPYSPSFNYYQPAPDLLAPARRAGLLMFVLAALSAMGAACCVGGGTMLPKLMQERPDAFANVHLPPEMTPAAMQSAAIVMGVISFVLAIAMVMLGIFVRRGGLGSIVTSIVLISLMLIGMLLNLASSLIVVGSGGGANMVLGLCMLALPLALCILLLVWLIQAARAVPRVRAAQQQYQMQMWQHQQHQAAYGGYGAQAQPPSPPPSSGDSHGALS